LQLTENKSILMEFPFSIITISLLRLELID